jgi:hypothetical protein
MSEPTQESPADENGNGVTAESNGSTRKPLAYAGPAAKRWARDTFNRDQIVSALKQLAWVAPLTFLIWVYAEREQQQTARLRFPVEVRTSNPRVIVRLSDPSDGYVSADLTGARVQLDDLRKELGPRMNPVRFEVPSDYKEGEHQIPVSAIVSRDARFDGLTASKSEPARITVVVDPIEEQTIAVQMRPEDNALFNQISYNPPRVKVQMPRQVYREATKGGKPLTAFADLSSLKETPPGKKTDISGIRVAVENADPDQVSIEPQTVAVSLNVLERAKDVKLDLPLQKQIPAGLPDDIVVKVDHKVVFDVVVSGPPEIVDKIPPGGGDMVWAYVPITDEDVRRQIVQKQPSFHAPAGTKVSYPRKEPVEVTITSSKSASP